jgi:hypothetical protein
MNPMQHPFPLAMRLAGLALASAISCAVLGCQAIDAKLSAKKPEPLTNTLIIAQMEKLSARWNQEPVPVGLDRQVFYDDALIAGVSGSVIRLQGRPTKLNGGKPVMEQDRWWENRHGNWGIGLYHTVLTNKEGLYRCWYMFGRNNEVGYAESKDGFIWEKPVLGISLDNRVLYPAHGACIMEDKHETRKAYRYKAVYGARERTTGTWRSVMFARSSDGIDWNVIDDIVWMDDQGTDTGNCLMWDDELQHYRIYIRSGYAQRRTRQMVRPVFDSGAFAMMRKMLFVPTKAEPWIGVGDMTSPRGELYAFFVQKIGSLYLAYVNVFIQGDYKGRGMTPTDRLDFDINDFYLATSRDGLNWDWSWVQAGEPFIERGPSGSFDQNGVWPPSSPLLTVNDKHLIYYCGRWSRHSRFGPGTVLDGVEVVLPKPRSAIGVTEIRRDGLIYRQAAGESSSLTTKSFVLEGDRIEVNCDAEQGTLAVELLDPEGVPLQGFGFDNADGIVADDCHRVLSWAGMSDLSALKGREVRLRFRMTGTVRLYAFEVLNTKDGGGS